MVCAVWTKKSLDSFNLVFLLPFSTHFEIISIYLQNNKKTSIQIMLHCFRNLPRNNFLQMSVRQRPPFLIFAQFCFVQTAQCAKSAMNLKHHKHRKVGSAQSNTQFNQRIATSLSINCANNPEVTTALSDLQSSAIIAVRWNIWICASVKKLAN